jgi:hypothetical protein
MSSGLLSALGVRVRRVADLREGAIYIADRKLLLLDIELTDHQIAEAIDSVLPAVPVPVAPATHPR